MVTNYSTKAGHEPVVQLEELKQEVISKSKDNEDIFLKI